MENEILSDAIRSAADVLGALIKDDERTKRLDAAMEDYERSEELNAIIAEYNTQQSLMASTAESDGAARDAIAARIDKLYSDATNHPVYTSYMEAKKSFDSLMSEVYGEIEYVITGSRPCSHDCSSCGGCH